MRWLRNLLVTFLALSVSVAIRLLVSNLGESAGEMIGLLNLLAFLALGGGIAAGSSLIPLNLPDWLTIGATIWLTAILFFGPTFLEYREWVERVDASSQELPANAQADLFLTADAGIGGFAGYYRYTARHSAWLEDAKPSSHLWLNESINWVKRIFYLIVSVLATILAAGQVEESGWLSLVNLIPVDE